jgi:hypothetical protein
LITGDDLFKLLDEYADASPGDMYELLEVWNVDAEGFKDFVLRYLFSAEEAYMQRKQDLDETIMMACCVGFILGYKTAMEVQTRREVDGNEIQGT